MKTLIIPILICLLSACNQPTAVNQNENTAVPAKSISVFNAAANEAPENLKHITEELVIPPLLPKYEQTVSGDPVVVEV